MTFSKKTFVLFLHKVAFVVLSVLLACGVLEIGLRLTKSEFGNMQKMPVHWILTDPDWTIDPELIYVKRATLLDIDATATRSSKVPLILTLGDSFTAGDPFPKDKSFPSQLQRSLAAESIPTEILNVGNSGYNPDQELILLKKVLQKGIQPKIVIWSFYPNDFYESGQWPNFTLDQNNQLLQLSGANNFIFQRQKFFEALPLPKNLKENSALVAAMLQFFNLMIDQEIPAQFRDPNSNFSWVEQKFELEVQEAKRLAQENNFTLVFVSIYPQAAYFSPEFLKEQGIEDNQSKEVQAFTRLLSSEKYYIPLELNTLLESRDHSLQPPWCVDGATYYFNAHGSPEDDHPLGQHHFNEHGYFLFGEIVKTVVAPLLQPKPN